MRKLYLLTAVMVALSIWILFKPLHAVQGPTQYNDVRMAATTGSIGGGALLLGACSSGTISIPGSIVGQNVVVNGSDGVPLGGSFDVTADVTSSGVITVNVCAKVAGTPPAKTYNVRVLP